MGIRTQLVTMKNRAIVYFGWILTLGLYSCEHEEKYNFNLLFPDGINFSFVYINSNLPLKLDTVKNVGLVINRADKLDTSYIEFSDYSALKTIENAAFFDELKSRNLNYAFNFGKKPGSEFDKYGNFTDNGVFIDYYIYNNHNASVLIYYKKRVFEMLFYNFENPDVIEQIINSIKLT